MKGTTTGQDIFSASKTVMEHLGLTYKKLVGATTDGAPAMIGQEKGAVSLLEKEMKEIGIENDIFRIHCIIHQGSLYAKSVKLLDVMKVIIKIVNFIRSRGLNHRQFQLFLDSYDTEHSDLVYYCDVRWLSRGEMLKRVYELREQIVTFMAEKGKPVPQLEDKVFLMDFSFLVDITAHLNDLNLKLQGKGNLITDMFDQVLAFEMKLKLYKNQFDEGNTFF